MEFSEPDPPESLTSIIRHKCAACFHQFKRKEHLVEHMRTSYHSVHQPKCGVCQKQCKTFESLREHISGRLPKPICSITYAEKGCDLCLKVFDSPSSLSEHKQWCCLPPPAPIGTMKMPDVEFQTEDDGNYIPKAIAIDCEMVGGGSDGSLDLCARVCLVDEEEKLIFHTYVVPQLPVSDYRYEITGITEEHLRDGMPLKEVQEKILQILYNGESIGRVRLEGGKARLLVGHNLDHDLYCLQVNYPDKLLRDTATYRPLTKTNFSCHSLKYLTKTYLGYDIQEGTHDPYEDSVSAMRLYKRMRSQVHQEEIASGTYSYTQQSFASVYDSFRPKDLENRSPEELLEMSRSNYRCWCLDSKQALQTW